jgi:hypothetical protein
VGISFQKGEPVKRIALFCVFCMAVLAAGCGGEGKVFLNNGTGVRLESVTLTIGGESQSWNGIEPDETFGSRLQVPEGEVQCSLSWEESGRTDGFDFTTISRAAEAKKVSIFFSLTELSVGYEF